VPDGSLTDLAVVVGVPVTAQTVNEAFAAAAATGTLVKVFGWYDNEWGYTARLADLAALVGSQL